VRAGGRERNLLHLAVFLPPAGGMKRKLFQTVRSERAVAGGRELHLEFRASDGAAVPAILMLPAAAGAAPAAVMLHGYSSRKEEMAGPVGRSLLAEGVASLAIDLPLHGTRSDPVQAQTARNPLAVVQLWRQALREARLGLRYLEARPEIDRARLALVGYSMGSFLSVIAAAEEPRVRAVVLAAGGDLPEGTPFAAAARLVADPVRAVRRLEGRPLLMVHGRNDRTVRPEQAERLFAAAGEPKEIRWWDAGHYLPQAASSDAAKWLRAQLDGAQP
jgi:uncharacterized protein